MNDIEHLEKLYEKLKSENMRHMVKVHSEIRHALHEFFIEKGFCEIPPIIIAPITDPLNHPVYKTHVDYYGYNYGITQSMIFHKQIALLSYDKVFIFSPNVRLEPLDRKSTGRHLAEFTQVDIEIKNASREYVMNLAEDMYIYVLKKVTERAIEDLEYFHRKISLPNKPFKKFDYSEYRKKLGDGFDMQLSKEEKDPFWLVDIPLYDREFYDRESEEKENLLVDMDMYYPEGYGEAISGGEREYQYERIIERIKKKGQNVQQFAYYLELAKKGLPRSAGFGIGVERLTRYITGIKNIEDTIPFPRCIGSFSF